ncbi:hypothetical protein BGZ76_010357 [Entomortierella beljakovae]|nr:hypothetical protein BGZ76_010357 [Entomortierella beljakovae]
MVYPAIYIQPTTPPSRPSSSTNSSPSTSNINLVGKTPEVSRAIIRALAEKRLNEILDKSTKTQANDDVYVSPYELEYYDRIWALLTPNKESVIPGSTAADFLSKCGLSKQSLLEVWTIADPSNTGVLNRGGFNVILKLIGHLQSGTLEASLSKERLPWFKGIPLPGGNQTQEYRQSPKIISDRDIDLYRMFQECAPVNGLLSGDKAKSLLLLSGLSSSVLAQIWDLADTQKRGSLDLAEFFVAAYYSTESAVNVPLPKTSPQSVLDECRRKAVELSEIKVSPSFTLPYLNALPSSSLGKLYDENSPESQVLQSLMRAQKKSDEFQKNLLGDMMKQQNDYEKTILNEALKIQHEQTKLFQENPGISSPPPQQPFSPYNPSPLHQQQHQQQHQQHQQHQHQYPHQYQQQQQTPYPFNLQQIPSQYYQYQTPGTQQQQYTALPQQQQYIPPPPQLQQYMTSQGFLQSHYQPPSFNSQLDPIRLASVSVPPTPSPSATGAAPQATPPPRAPQDFGHSNSTDISSSINNPLQPSPQTHIHGPQATIIQGPRAPQYREPIAPEPRRPFGAPQGLGDS